jgi:hypothetical protein
MKAPSPPEHPTFIVVITTILILISVLDNDRNDYHNDDPDNDP